MNTARAMLIAGLSLVVSLWSQIDHAAEQSGYEVQPGDVLDVAVWREEGLQREVLVRSDGAFSFPLAGDVRAAGRRIEAVREELTKRLAKYIPEPEVTVSLRQPAGNVVFVIGQVNRPGQIAVQRPLDVIQALGIAGGLTRFADRDDIKVLRRQGETQVAMPFNYDDIEKGRALEQNIILEPGDVVMVP